MSNIYIDLTKENLEEQFLGFSNQLLRKVSFRVFVEACLPGDGIEHGYNLFTSAIDMGIIYDEKKDNLRNVVMYPCYNPTQSLYLPKDMSFYLMGELQNWPSKSMDDRTNGDRYKYYVTSINIIDKSLLPSEPHCVSIRGWAQKAYKNGCFSKGSDFDGLNWLDNAISQETILSVVSRSLFTDDEMTEMNKLKNDWQNYIHARDHFLANASAHKYKFDRMDLIEAYTIAKSHYQDSMDDYLLDGHKEFKPTGRDESAIITKNVIGAEPCRILKITKRVNKQDIDTDENRRLTRLLRNQLKLTVSDNPKDSNSISLGSGDEILIKGRRIITEEEPNIHDIEKAFEKNLETLKKKYESSIRRLSGNEGNDVDSVIAKQKLDKQFKQDTEKLEKDKKERIEKRIEEKTVIRTEIYLKIDDSQWVLLKKNGSNNYNELAYDPFMENIRLSRQKKSLNKLIEGDVLNPMMSRYLFFPETLQATQGGLNVSDIEWKSSKPLNHSQKDAVCKALNSSGIFLLQGPPGTGKTTVIAELTAQLVMRGKRVLIASETHKAIDNAFEDIDDMHLPQVRMVRLVNSDRKNDTKWNIDKQTENFYNTILRNLEGQTEVYRQFLDQQENFEKKLPGLYSRNRRIMELRTECLGINRKIESLTRDINEIQKKCSSTIGSISETEEELERTKKLLSCVEKLDLDISDEDDPHYTLGQLKNKLYSILDKPKYDIFKTKNFKMLVTLNPDDVERDLRRLDDPDELTKLGRQIAETREKMSMCRDEYDNIISEKKSDFYKLKSLLGELINKRNNLSEIRATNTGRQPLHDYFKSEYIDSRERRKSIPQTVSEFKEDTKRVTEETKSELNKDLHKLETKKESLESQKREFDKNISEYNKTIKQLHNKPDFLQLKTDEAEMKKELEAFFVDFGIQQGYPEGDYSAAIDRIEKEWKSIKTKFERDRDIYEKQREIHESIRGYINGGAIERDQNEMKEKLVKRANVIGLTSTGKESDREGIIDLKDINIDVVIIDEVSKSSFLDLLRPMQFGKTSILVGDHMQLPPMYDLKHLRDEDFDGLDENIMSPSKNREYTELVERCYFEEMFNRAPESYRTMLTLQYRFHSDILKINPFYGQNLACGLPNLDNSKQHNISIFINERPIIDPDTHVCFIDCGDSYDIKAENSTSLINEGEKDVVLHILKELGQHIGGSNRLSVGVICTYRKQAHILANEIFKKDKKSYSALMRQNGGEERFVISTVDDFQGDERDIIILSMVRNPRNWKQKRKINLDFIKAFQRINVAITRPRRLLIIVGAMDFLQKKAVVTLIENGMEKEVHIFRDMLEQIHSSGKILLKRDIIPDNQDFNTARRK